MFCNWTFSFVHEGIFKSNLHMHILDTSRRSFCAISSLLKYTEHVNVLSAKSGQVGWFLISHSPTIVYSKLESCNSFSPGLFKACELAFLLHACGEGSSCSTSGLCWKGSRGTGVHGTQLLSFRLHACMSSLAMRVSPLSWSSKSLSQLSRTHEN